MSADALKPLMFTVGLVDKITGPAQKATKSFDGLITTAKSGFRDMAAGAIGLAGTGALIYQSLTPAIEMNRALGALASLEMDDKQLKEFSNSTLTMSSNFGIAATELTGAAYSLQSAMGLTADELSSVTEASAVMAKATLADTGTITSYVTTMFGVFKNDANAMGRSKWIEQLTGQTAEAVRMFRTSGPEMAAAFGNLTSTATDAGVVMSEQIAILGTLQNVIPSGSEAATAYRSFLAGAQKAQESLGVQLYSETDPEQLLPITAILKNIEGLGSADLTSAFGSQEAMKFISVLRNNIGSLEDGLEGIGKISGTEKALQMAEKNTDPWQRLEQAINNVRVAFGQALLPAIEPVVEWMGKVSNEVLYWTQLFPNLTKLLGLTVLTILALGAGMAALTLAAGLGKAAWAGFLMVMKLGKVVTMAITAAQWAMNAAFIASPVGLIIIGITALVAVLYAAWMGIKALWNMFADTAAGKAFISMIEGIVDWFKSLGGIVDWVIEKLNNIPGVNIGVESEQPELPNHPSPALPESIKEISELPGFKTTPEQVSNPVAIPLLPEVEALPSAPMPQIPVLPPETAAPAVSETRVIETTGQLSPPLAPEQIYIEPVVDVESLNIDVPYRQESVTNEVPTGGITNQISKSVSDNSNKTTQVSITTNQTMTPALMNEFLLMEGA